MRPLKLALSGFACFREPTEVSFEDLELFAISGATGSGKSTLLDAITYALYGQTARLGKQLGETLFSPNLDKLSVQLTFRAGDATYRVARISERKGARGPKNETRLERLGGDASWKQLPESEKLKEANDKLESIVGLKYEDFTRAVLLPQGAFDRFLHAKPAERTDLLGGLLGFSVIREMQRRAGGRAREDDLKAKALEERLRDYEGATPERRRALNAELGALREEQKGLLAAREVLAERLKDLEVLTALVAERAGVGRGLGALKAQEVEIAHDRARLARAQDAEKLLPHLNDLEAHRSRVAQLGAQAGRVREGVGAAEVSFAAAERALLAAQTDASRLPELQGRLDGLAEARLRFAQLKSRRGTLALAAEAREPYSEEAWEALQTRVQALPALERARGEVTDAQMRRNQAQAAVAQLGAARLEAEGTLTQLEAEGKAARLHKERAEAAYAEAVRVAPAAALRPHLHVGEACPVCEQPVAVLPPPVSGDASALERTRDEAVVRYNGLKERYLEQKGELKTLSARLEDEGARLTRAEADLSHRQKQLVELAEGLGNKEPARLRSSLQAAQRALLGGLAADILERTQGLDPDAAHAALTRERAQLSAALQGSQTVFHEAQRALDRLHAEAQSLGERLEEATQAQARADGVFTELLARTAFADPAALREAALPPVRQAALRERTERYAHDLEQLTRQDVELEKRLAGRTLLSGTLEAAQAERAQNEARLGEVQRRGGELSGELTRLEAQLETAKRLRAERGEHERSAALYGTLSRDLMANNFQAYLLARVQDELAQRASDILKTVTDGRYDLFFRDDEYTVLDAWTGSVRSARTLSGGESFITSLALALALSDTLAGSTSLGALFLDEGFGTLDAETLEGVAKVLESLTAHGRMVGVITHVAALTERLPDRLLVSKGPEGSGVTWDGL